jgi:hypothetical protein
VRHLLFARLNIPGRAYNRCGNQPASRQPGSLASTLKKRFSGLVHEEPRQDARRPCSPVVTARRSRHQDTPPQDGQDINLALAVCIVGHRIFSAGDPLLVGKRLIARRACRC